MARGIDHIVHVVSDLDRAGEFYAAIGFTVGARNRHPWGTHNRIVQFPGCFVEMLTVAEPERLVPEGIPLFFGRFAQNALAVGPGLAMLALESRNAARDAQEFRSAGIALSDALRFEREGRRPDGTAVKVGFSVAFVADPRIAVRCFICEQHWPENFWNPDFQRHPNGALAISGVVFVAAQPADHVEFFRAFTGGEVTTTEYGLVAGTPRGEIAAMSAEQFLRDFGVPAPDCRAGAVLAAMRFAVADPAALAERLQARSIPCRRHGERLVVPAESALGATLLFERP